MIFRTRLRRTPNEQWQLENIAGTIRAYRAQVIDIVKDPDYTVVKFNMDNEDRAEAVGIIMGFECELVPGQ